MIYTIILLGTASIIRAWPIQPYDSQNQIVNQRMMASCGDIKTIIMSPNKNSYYSIINFTPGCKINLNFLMNNTMLPHYGFTVNVSMDIMDSDNINGCSSTNLTITDSDEINDKNTKMESYCGYKNVSFSSFEDYVDIILTSGPNVKAGSSFNFTVIPTYECGGNITENVVITSPEYPNTFPEDSRCTWEVVVTANSKAIFECSEFILPNSRNDRCKTYILENIHGSLTISCGHTLEGEDKKMTFPTGKSLLYFRASKFPRTKPGETAVIYRFKCKLTYYALTAREIIKKLIL